MIINFLFFESTFYTQYIKPSQRFDYAKVELGDKYD